MLIAPPVEVMIATHFAKCQILTNLFLTHISLRILPDCQFYVLFTVTIYFIGKGFVQIG